MANKESKSRNQSRSRVQNYPRIDDPDNEYSGFLDTETLVPHLTPRQISEDMLKKLINEAIERANIKSSRDSLNMPEGLSEEQEAAFYKQEGRKLFEYFHDYPIDPAATAQEYVNKDCKQIAVELFRTRTQQKGRMNSGWRYQFLAVNCAAKSGRFLEVSGFGTSQGDFTARAEFLESPNTLHLYVSVKNRSDTLGGQDWPNAITALESYAMNDLNKTGPYLCVFGVAMDRGMRRIPANRNKQAYSVNTEVWLSDFFWPFFSNYSYEEIMTVMLEVLVERESNLPSVQIEVPDALLDYFVQECRKANLVNEQGVFNNPFALVKFFCGKTPPKTAKKYQ
jgi:hypothetical protein